MIAPAPISGPATPLDAASEQLWRAPLVPVALAVTAGVVLDRSNPIPVFVSLLTILTGAVAWAVTWKVRASGVPLLFVAAAFVAVGAGWHRVRQLALPWDVGRYAEELPRPVRLRGVVETEPTPLPVRATEQPFRSWPLEKEADPTLRTTLRVIQLHDEDGWHWATGQVVVWTQQPLHGLHPGDWVEVSGLLERPHGPSNPGEFDHAAHLADLGIRAAVRADDDPNAVTRLTQGWPLTLRGWLAVVRGWAHRVLRDSLGPERSGVAGALLLGEGATMTPEQWDVYQRTGVVHVLAISGQHLIVLGWFLATLLVVLRVPGRRAAVLIALLLFAYALLTGGRPPILRAAFMVALLSGGRILRRPVMASNVLAFAWLCIAFVDPTEIFDTGCQLSFLAVAVLHWGVPAALRSAPAWLPSWLKPLPPEDPLDQLVEESHPFAVRMALWLWRMILQAFVASFAVGLVVMPLVAARMHLFTPVGVFLGPPVVLLTSIALVTGFLLLISAAVFPPLVTPLAWVTGACLAGCDGLVTLADQLPLGHFYVPDVPGWWLWGFYGGCFALLWLPRLRGPWAAAGAVGWCCVGLIAVLGRVPSDELRCTFLSVGHGACVVMETPDGRVILYDAGSLAGPDAARRQIAPYLWHRGIRRIDEVMLSHADLDHFNGLPPLLERFTIGRVTLTPSFDQKQSPGVDKVLEALGKRGVGVRRVWAGQRLTAGDVEMRVLHPPEDGPVGNENARSLVLEVQYAGRTILLTGDLEGAGLARVLALDARTVDVLLAPHHGSAAADPQGFAAWARPAVVVSSQRRGEGRKAAAVYESGGARFLGTDAHGAVTVRVHLMGMVVETFRTRKMFVVAR